MAMRSPEVSSEKLQEPAELELRDWGDDIVFAETDNIGGWIMVDPESTVTPEP